MIRRLIVFIRGEEEPDDLAIGDAVKADGHDGVGWLKDIRGDYGTVSWDKDCRSILPLTMIHRVRAKATGLDTRRK